MRAGIALILLASCVGYGRGGFDHPELRGDEGSGDPSGGDERDDFALGDLVASYVTPTNAYLTWTPTGAPSDFDHYEIWLGATALQASDPNSAQIWGPAEDTNLSELYVEGPKTIARSIVTGLTPETTYFATLRAIGGTGAPRYASPITSFTTVAGGSNVITIFADEKLSTWEIPSGGSRLDATHPYRGTHALALDTYGDPGGFVYHYAGLSIALDAIDDLAFQDAYVELAIECTGNISHYTEVMLVSDSNDITYSWPHYFTCQPGYRLYQLPLRFMRVAGQPGSGPAQRSDWGTTLEQFWSYGVWQTGTVYFDEISIRW